MLLFIKRNKYKILILIFLSFLAYINIFQNDFLSDDLDGIVNNPEIGNLNLTLSSQNIVNLINTLTFLFFGLSKPAFHFVNISLHAANVILVFLLLNIIDEKPSSKISAKDLAFPTSIIFALHPLQTESVTWISGKPYSIYTLFILISTITFILYTKSRSKVLLAVSFLSFFLSLYTSEKAIILPLLLGAYLFTFKKIKSFLPSLGLVSFAALPFIFKLSTSLTNRVSAINPSYAGGVTYYNPITQIPTAIASYIELFILPINLTLYHAYLLIPPELVLKFSLTLLFLIVYIISFKKSRLVFFFLSFFLISLMPTLLPVMVGWIVAERYVYLGSIGLSLTLTFLIYQLGDKLKSKEIPIILISSISLIYLLLSLNRNFQWKSQDTLWPATITRSEYVPVAHNNMGDYYARHNDIESSIHEFERANRLTGDKYPDAIYNLGTMYLEKKDSTKAAELFKKTVSLDPTIIEPYYQLSQLYLKQQNFNDAEDWALKSLKINPKSAISLDLLGVINYRKNNLPKAKEYFQKALLQDPQNADYQKSLQTIEDLLQ